MVLSCAGQVIYLAHVDIRSWASLSNFLHGWLLSNLSRLFFLEVSYTLGFFFEVTSVTAIGGDLARLALVHPLNCLNVPDEFLVLLS